jgi:hypothetical protein
MVPTVSAAGDKTEDAAQTLYELGLFKGTGTNEDGTPIFSLDKTPSRNEAIVMLVRLLGKEEEALNGTWNTPFTDLVNWAKPYVGYAYANGLTNGTSSTTFSGTNPIPANQYVTFVLRALGYSSETDFTVSDPWDLASSALGISEPTDSDFTRGDVASISVSALSATVTGSGQTLLEKLEADGAVTQTAQKTTTDSDIPADLTFKEIDESYYAHWTFRGDGTLLFPIQSVEYAVSGDYAYFRIRFQDNAATKFLVRPLNWGYDETADGEWIKLESWVDHSAVWTAYNLETNVCNYGEILILDADGESDVFTCKVPMSWFENYADLIIAPYDDDGTLREYIRFYTAYLFNDLESLTYQTADYEIEFNKKEEDFELVAAEYAEVLGGRMYRITYTNTEPVTLKFTITIEDGLNWNYSLFQKEEPQAGDNVSYYFVSVATMEKYDDFGVGIWFPGNYSGDVGIDIYF